MTRILKAIAYTTLAVAAAGFLGCHVLAVLAPTAGETYAWAALGWIFAGAGAPVAMVLGNLDG